MDNFKWYKRIILILSIALSVLIFLILGGYVKTIFDAPAQPQVQAQETETTASLDESASQSEHREADGTVISETTVPDKENADVTAPVISGVKDFIVHAGSRIAYKEGVTVTDDMDPDPKLEIINDKVDISTIGIYTVIYVAADASGNVAYDAAKVQVVAPEKISIDEANELADEVLDRIITDDMTTSEKLEAVWWYLNGIGYVDVDYGQPDDYLENAYYFLKNYQGNCRCSYAASKLLLERMGYLTLKVENRDGAAITHYWNMVSVDGGETYYHFDPTSWGWGDTYELCMVTDDYLIDYSQRHDNEIHDWDLDLYPNTPKEEFDPDFFVNRVITS